MSIIQQIQEKYAKLMAVIIAVALITFVVMLAFENGGSLFNSGNSTTVGVVNGKKIDYNEFQQMAKAQENQMKMQYSQYGMQVPEGASYQASNAAWNQQVSKLLLESEFDKLGLQIGKKELGDILYGANPPADLRQQFTNQETGQYDAQGAKAAIDQMFRSKNKEQAAQVSQYIDQLEFSRMYEKYNALLTNSFYYPKWKIEKENAESSQMARISFVREVYSSIPDSTIKVTDKEIEEYISKHKDEFKQEENRSIAYVSFSALPTAVDTAVTLNEINKLKPEFDTTHNAEEMIGAYGSSIPFSESYVPGSELKSVNQQMGLGARDSILFLPKGGVLGPYLDGGNYVLAKMLDSKVLPDSVKCRHVLISTKVQEGGFEDSVASRKIDSIENAIKGGASWASMVEKYNPQSDGSRQQNGEMTFSSTQIQSANFAPEFARFILFDGKPGDRKKVKTSFGWHYIEIMSFIKPETHYQVAYLSLPITASKQTDNNASNEATKFAGDSRDEKSFDANVDKLKEKNISKMYATNIRPDDYQVQSLGISRSFVKHIYEAKKGEVLQPERIGPNYVVAVVTEVNKEGTQSVAAARMRVEPLLINHKKAEQLIKKAEGATTLEAVSAAFNGQLVETADSVRLRPEAGQQQPQLIAAEPKVIGAAFYPGNKGKISAPIEGRFGVYVVRVDDVTATSVSSADISAQMQSRYQEGKGRPLNVDAALKEAATIKDNRSKFF